MITRQQPALLALKKGTALRFALFCLALPFVIGCKSDKSAAQGTRQGTVGIEQGNGQNEGGVNTFADGLSALSDDFSNPDTLQQWEHVYKTEGWRANQLQRLNIKSGWLTMMPFSSTWYQDYRGVMMYKPVSGNFVVTTRLRVTGRTGGVPNSLYSLAGLMVRVPRNVTPQTWQRGGENYVFLSLGAANSPRTNQFEVKTTQNSDSQLQISNADSNFALLQVARVGSWFIMLKKTSSGWSVHRRYTRPDFPAALQVGLTCYTDWNTASQLTPEQHNNTVIKSGSPDLLAKFDYVRFKRPIVPKNANLETMSDQEILRFLGDAGM